MVNMNKNQINTTFIRKWLAEASRMTEVGNCKVANNKSPNEKWIYIGKREYAWLSSSLPYFLFLFSTTTMSYSHRMHRIFARKILDTHIFAKFSSKFRIRSNWIEPRKWVSDWYESSGLSYQFTVNGYSILCTIQSRRAGVSRVLCFCLPPALPSFPFFCVLWAHF